MYMTCASIYLWYLFRSSGSSWLVILGGWQLLASLGDWRSACGALGFLGPLRWKIVHRVNETKMGHS